MVTMRTQHEHKRQTTFAFVFSWMETLTILCDSEKATQTPREYFKIVAVIVAILVVLFLHALFFALK